MTRKRSALGAACLLVACALGACGGKSETPVAGADPDRGRSVIVAYGCGACHVIPGIPEANGTVGPSLASFSQQRFVAGELPNTIENTVRWIMNPPGIHPETVMPDLGLTESQARDVAAYLYSR